MSNYEEDFIRKQKLLRQRTKGCICQSCGVLFTVDLLIPDTLWNVIKPENEKGEMIWICEKCIDKLAASISA